MAASVVLTLKLRRRYLLPRMQNQMGKNMDKTWKIRLRVLGVPQVPTMKNHMEKKMDNETETGLDKSLWVLCIL